MKKTAVFLFLASFMAGTTSADAQKRFSVIVYYSGGPEAVDSLEAGKITHIVFHGKLSRNQFTLRDGADTLTLRKLVALKTHNPHLKVLLSIGGWGGCLSCSDIFSTPEGRAAFTESFIALNRNFQTDGIDIDWQYPSIEGYPGHTFRPEDRTNLTKLLQELRQRLDKRYEISLTAGAFRKFLERSVDWKSVGSLIDRVHILSTDLLNNYSEVTGHHAALYSTPRQEASADFAVKYLLAQGISPGKLVIGAALYGRIWQDVGSHDSGLYQKGWYKAKVPFNRLASELPEERGYHRNWDDVAKAPFIYNPVLKYFCSYDDHRSVSVKAEYVVKTQLNGIMFREVTNDIHIGKLIDVTHQILSK